MALAMSQAGKLFDKKNAGSSGGDKAQDKAQGEYMTLDECSFMYSIVVYSDAVGRCDCDATFLAGQARLWGGHVQSGRPRHEIVVTVRTSVDRQRL